jgi:hypothetical protein
MAVENGMLLVVKSINGRLGICDANSESIFSLIPVPSNWLAMLWALTESARRVRSQVKKLPPPFGPYSTTTFRRNGGGQQGLLLSSSKLGYEVTTM